MFISGIGCSSRFPYYMNTYGFHTIHGRAPAIATGLKLARPELKVFVVTGDGDGLSHRRQPPAPRAAAQRGRHDPALQQPDLRAHQGPVLADERAGQGDQVHAAGLGRPAAQPAARSRSAAGATFVARTVDRNIAHMEETLKRAAAHKGAAFVEILQNCNVYNDLAWNVLYDKESKVLHELRLEHGKPLLFGPADDRRGLVLEGVKPKVVTVKDVPESALWVHDETDRGDRAGAGRSSGRPTTRSRSGCSPASRARRPTRRS